MQDWSYSQSLENVRTALNIGTQDSEQIDVSTVVFSAINSEDRYRMCLTNTDTRAAIALSRITSGFHVE